MNKQEELNLLLSGNPPERVLFYPILMHFAARYSGHSYSEFASDYRILVGSNIRCLQDFDYDMVSLISDPYRETSAFGAEIEFVPDGVPKCLTKVISEPGDIAHLMMPDLLNDRRTRDRIEGARHYRTRLGSGIPVMGWVEGPLAEACDLAGVAEMLMMLMTDPGPAEMLLDKCLVTGMEFATRQVEAGCSLIGIGDAICSQIDPETYRTFIFERHRKLVEHIHSLGVPVKMHICGNTTHLWPWLSRLGLDIFDLDYMVDPDEAYVAFGPEVVRCGNINPLEVQNLDPVTLEERACALLERERNRRFMLSAGCEITVSTPPANLHALRNSVNQYSIR